MSIQIFPGKSGFYVIDWLRGTNIMKAFKELHKQQYLPLAELNAIRQQRLNDLFETAKNNVPFYRNYNSYDQLPVLTKKMLLDQYQDFFFLPHKKGMSKKTTGGSTSEPFAYYTTKESVSYMWAGILLSWEMTGYKPGEKVVFLAGSSLIKSGWQHKLFYYLLNVDVLPASPLDDAIMDKYALRICKNKAAVLYGYSYAINTLAEFINRTDKKYSFPHLKGIVSTAELLTDSARKKIEKAFGVRVYDQYGCNEGGVSAFECEHHNKHLISTRVAYQSDENNTLISTDLFNSGFVMMKYNTSDIVEFSDKRCSCNRSFPVIEKLVGRLNDVVVDMENKVLHASFFGIALSKENSIQQYQVTFDNDSINININTSNNDEAYFFDRYMPTVKQYARFQHYTVTINQPFEKAPNGKHREVVDKRKLKERIYTE